jgi:L-ascorbate metabolism protein UlaG (beta-lactamase superfamily)
MSTRIKRLALFTGVVVMSLFVAGFAALRSSSLGARATGDRLERMKASPQYGEKAFVNTMKTTMAAESNPLGSAWEFITNDAQVKPEVELPVTTPGSLDAVGDDRLRITWMGHSSMLIEIDGHIILTDPVWGPRASPFSWAGPARFHETPGEIEDLPKLDAVVLSHDHYDHLDYPSILRLSAMDTNFVVPLGLGAHLESWGVPPERITELDWWQEHTVGDLRLVSTPARHFSGRSITDRNSTLWSSWAIIGPQHRAWFSGDTGPAPFFDEIGERFGPFDVSMVEIGAYHPSWGVIHLGPEAAVGVHQQVRAKTMIPVHWGTFNLALHAWDAPVIELSEFADKAGVTIAVPVVGGTVDPAEPFVDPFWLDRIGSVLDPGA